VHPDDRQAAKLDPPDLGKTEAWVVLAAEPGSRIYAGLKPGVDRVTLERKLAAGECDACLHEFEPQPGDCVFIEAGTVHALGAGLLVAEIQQASDTTYRLFDWNRVDQGGKPRPLHIREALETIDYSRGPVDPQQPRPTGKPHAERLVACDKFVLDRLRIAEPQRLGTDNRFHIVAAIEGAMTMESEGGTQQLRRGDTVLIPAAGGEVDFAPLGKAALLDMYLP
jgi:mannose-6-phosphate isomerase